jgi:hypothetical protein
MAMANLLHDSAMSTCNEKTVLAHPGCPPVCLVYRREDFAGYWDKGVRDPALEGRWKKLGMPGEEIGNIPGADTLLFVSDGRSYSMHMIILSIQRRLRMRPHDRSWTTNRPSQSGHSKWAVTRS